MTEIYQQCLTALAPHNLGTALERIETQCNWFIDAYGADGVSQQISQLRVSFSSAGHGADEHVFLTPLGEIKVRFAKRLENPYLGVAAVFSHKNQKSEDEKFFVVYMNHQSPWKDSTGHQFSTEFSNDMPKLFEAAKLIQRVMAALLQKLDKAAS